MKKIIALIVVWVALVAFAVAPVAATPTLDGYSGTGSGEVNYYGHCPAGG